MPNIMLTDACNLRCPYCFASEFVNRWGANEISLENFRKAVDFIVKDGVHSSVGLIGGEPTLHAACKTILRQLIADDRVRNIRIFTNGLELDGLWQELRCEKIDLIINCNPPAALGLRQYEKICANLARLVDDLQARDRILPGINLYGTDFAYDYMLELLTHYGFRQVRVSVTVPNPEEGIPDPREYFSARRDRLHAFFTALLERGVVPIYDCNKPPSCLLPEERRFRYGELLDRLDAVCYGNYDIRTVGVGCDPVVDILQDLTAVRCFGLSRRTKVRIEDFENVSDLIQHYRQTVDEPAGRSASMDRCVSCDLHKTGRCTGGCLLFKSDRPPPPRQSSGEGPLPAQKRSW